MMIIPLNLCVLLLPSLLLPLRLKIILRLYQSLVLVYLHLHRYPNPLFRIIPML